MIASTPASSESEFNTLDLELQFEATALHQSGPHGPFGLNFPRTRATTWRCADRLIHFERPLIMGVVNVTPDSFSDGGLHAGADEAITWANKLLDQGADILDIGGESTRPGAQPVSIEEELARVIPVIEALAPTQALISIDTRHASVAEAALKAGAHIINDVSGFRDPAMVDVAARSSAGLIVMHMLGTPDTMQQEAQTSYGAGKAAGKAAQQIHAYLLKQAHMLEAAGVARERIMLDPGPGFGKLAAQDWALQLAMRNLVELGYPVCQAVSRKRFIGELSGIATPKDRDVTSIALSLSACMQGVHVVRVHNVDLCYQALCGTPLFFGKQATCYVGLGANIDEPLDKLRWAAQKLNELPLTQVTAASQIYESEPAYYTDQPAFYNAVVELKTALPALVLLKQLLKLEQEAGRVRLVENGPRSLDLDLLLYGVEQHGGQRLTLPHPGIAERDFVLKPLLELMDAASLSRHLWWAGVDLAPALEHPEQRVGQAHPYAPLVLEPEGNAQ